MRPKRINPIISKKGEFLSCVLKLPSSKTELANVTKENNVTGAGHRTG